MERRDFMKLAVLPCLPMRAAPGAASFTTQEVTRVTRAFSTPGHAPNGLQATGDGLWVLDQETNRAALVRYDDGHVIRQFDTETDRGSGITFDGEAVWIASTYNRLLVRVDAQNGIRDPIGMLGQRLEANVHIVTASSSATQNLVTAANKAGILINDTVLEPLASAEACLTQDERDLGCCLLDIGGGTTEVIVYGGGVVRHTGGVAIGGDHFTNDLAVGLRTPIPEAEKIKHRHGCAAAHFLHDDGAIEIASVGDRPPRTVFARMITDIIEPRAQELLALIGDDLRRSGLDRQIPAGFIFAGGGARLNGLAELAEQDFHLPVRMGEPRGILDLPEQVAQPEYATAVGLVLCAAKARRAAPQRSNNLVSKLKAMFAGA